MACQLKQPSQNIHQPIRKPPKKDNLVSTPTQTTKKANSPDNTPVVHSSTSGTQLSSTQNTFQDHRQ
ncbi:hypothetical protein PtA15_2A366 [Puccinia triticina]|uniref:Uncharacterized protein n=1 Tax=Puccinia triticina TaxID=208348 RepID=A0ABY7CAW9_9BASI|nr:uncharacterized protein PtA15_2A366 [Puccinia triticina]WAQ82053.1 hypothetical protein PtA15_2A366 [Puccinia triticina]